MGWTIGIQFPEEAMRGFFLFANEYRLLLGPTQSPTKGVPEALTPGVKRPGREVGNTSI
jgi:hypothetical protein